MRKIIRVTCMYIFFSMESTSSLQSYEGIKTQEDTKKTPPPPTKSIAEPLHYFTATATLLLLLRVGIDLICWCHGAMTTMTLVGRKADITPALKTACKRNIKEGGSPNNFIVASKKHLLYPCLPMPNRKNEKKRSRNAKQRRQTNGLPFSLADLKYKKIDVDTHLPVFQKTLKIHPYNIWCTIMLRPSSPWIVLRNWLTQLGALI